jgi:two-component system, NarL family, response regulator EvgA
LKRILIADDHEVIRTGVKTLLSNAPYVVCGEAADGVEAIEQISRTEPDLVILDVSMPRMSGAEVLLKIRVLWPSLKVILFTMHTPELLSHLPADAIICKEHAALKLLKTIEMLLGKSEKELSIQ